MKICYVAISKSSIGTSSRYVRTYMYIQLSIYLWHERCDVPLFSYCFTQEMVKHIFDTVLNDVHALALSECTVDWKEIL